MNKNIEIELSEEQRQQLLTIYVTDNLDSASIDVFTSYINDGKSINEATSMAILNASIVNILTQLIKENNEIL